ncbi:MAG: hypothetical protein A4S09_10055 [Proteobacteria bacterium SG_bin7]|nr:MAG: hypothetical protein A4S09_10055 [Proteobacteria bacterium SG_bin7]
MTQQTSFWQDTREYANQIWQFNKIDWQVYFAWVGLMLGLLFSVTAFILVGHFNNANFPPYVWNVPIGTLIFVGAIAFDTIGHRTTYKEYLKKGESLVHHITIFAGVTSVLALCLCYSYPDFFKIPAISLIALSIFYSMIDEALHWHRYLNQKSDRVEMWSHFFIFLGHTIMVLAWYHWFDQGYPGVKETLITMQRLGLI